MSALETAVAVAREQGIRVDEPVVIRDLTNLLVRLDPSPVVARVPRTLARLRGREWFARELEVVSWLASAGAPVAPPATSVDPGPHERDGFVVTFWDAVDHDPARFDAAAAGRALRELHETLARWEGELPPFHRLDEIGRLLDMLRPSDVVSREDIDGMRAVRDLLAAQPLPPLRPIHGDSHFNNILWTPDGPRWTDFENLCAGPVEFDLACISWRERPENEAAFAAYGPHDEELRARMEPYLALFLAPWTVVIAERRPDHGIDEARRRVRKALEPLAD